MNTDVVCLVVLFYVLVSTPVGIWLGWQLHKFFKTGEDNNAIGQKPDDPGRFPGKDC